MVDENLLNYVNKQTSKGINKEDIKKALLYSGWPEDYVNEALNYKPVDEVIIKEQPKKKGISTLFIVIVLSIIVISSVLAYLFIFSDTFKDNQDIINENLSQNNNEILNENLNQEEEIINNSNLSDQNIEMLSLNKDIILTKNNLTMKYKEKVDDGYILSIYHLECGELDILLRDIYLYECYDLFKTIILEESLSSEEILTISFI
jgi:hypothetical protein